MWLNLSSCAVDLTQGLVLRDGERASLTPLELGVLRALAQPPLRMWSHQDLLTQVWQGGSVRALESTIRRLRLKLEGDAGEPEHVQSHYGRGYALVVQTLGGPAPRGELLAWIQDLGEQGPVRIWGPPGSGLQGLQRQAQRRGVNGIRVGLGGEGQQVLVGSLEEAQAEIFLREQLLRPLSDLTPLLVFAQGLPQVLLELAKRAALLDPEELIAAVKADPAALLPESHAQALAFWSALPTPLQQACGPLAWVQREGLPFSQAAELVGMDSLEALHRAGALLRLGPQDRTRVALPRLLCPFAQNAKGAATYAHAVVSRARVLKPLVHEEEGQDAVAGLVALLPELPQILSHFLENEPDRAAELLGLVNTAYRRRGMEADIERLQLLVLPHSAALSPQAASGFFQERSERLRMAGDLVAATNFARQGLDQARICGSHQELGLALAQVAILHHHAGDYQQALPVYEEALGVEGLAPRHQATLLANLAAVQRALGEGLAAEATLRALLAQDSLGSSKGFGVHRTLAFLYINRGEHSQVQEMHRRMAPLLLGRESSVDGAILGVQRGLLALDQGAALSALADLERAAELALSIGEHRTQAMAMDYAGAACLLLKRDGQALELLAESALAYGQAGRPALASWPLAWRALAAVVLETAQEDLGRAELLGGAEDLCRLARAHLRLLQAETPVALRLARKGARRILFSLALVAEQGAEIRVALRWLRARWALH
ncbi:MAG: tetratricopeptide (TPR) repeat protein [Cognaticolwellia sp.]|jgi:tetratricopeptide (TPR) repeat protein